MKKITVYLISVFLMFSCAKQEGQGGLASIKGVVMIQNINSQLQKVGEPYPAQDEDVFISYGSSNLRDDDVTTSPNGEFEFSYLMPGSYTIFAYSDDTVNYSNNSQLAIYSSVEIKEKKENAKLDTIILYKYVDYDEGSAVINGTVYQQEYFPGSSTLIMDTIPAQDVDVFLINTGNNQILERVRTIYNGNYSFSNLIPGEYTVYVYGEKPYVNELQPISYSFQITEEYQIKEIQDLYISNYSKGE